MKKARSLLALSACLAVAFLIWKSFAAESPPSLSYEYATIRWTGRDDTHLIRPGGHVEFIGPELRKMQRPDRTDERSFYLNLALNGLAKEGFELLTMTPDDLIMKRHCSLANHSKINPSPIRGDIFVEAQKKRARAPSGAASS